MRHRFPRTRFVRRHRSRPRWLPQPVDLLDDCRRELALIAERRKSG